MPCNSAFENVGKFTTETHDRIVGNKLDKRCVIRINNDFGGGLTQNFQKCVWRLRVIVSILPLQRAIHFQQMLFCAKTAWSYNSSTLNDPLRKSVFHQSNVRWSVNQDAHLRIPNEIQDQILAHVNFPPAVQDHHQPIVSSRCCSRKRATREAMVAFPMPIGPVNTNPCGGRGDVSNWCNFAQITMCI